MKNSQRQAHSRWSVTGQDTNDTHMHTQTYPKNILETKVYRLKKKI